MDALNYLFIVNPAAGQKNSPQLDSLLRDAVEGSLFAHTATIVHTKNPGHGAELAADFAAQHGASALIVACGGDGTAHEIASAVMGTSAAMSILPLGTGNDFARAALSSRLIPELLKRIAAPTIRPIDLIAVNDHICLNITSFGFDTRVQRLMMTINKRFRWLGRLSYPLAIAGGLLGNKRFTLRYGDAQLIQTDYILAALCNGRFYGGGFNPAPQAQLDDGQAELILIDPLPLGRILQLIPIYKKGQHLADPAVHLQSVQSGTIEALPGQLLLGNVDGELFESARIDFKVIPQAIRFAFY
ncbi:MAG: diacylglycerol kinase family lipid kinase [Eubacteriales bacterium]|nr:diacylglycerol kinase family lipid kinase [Eubacteriales bacterium]